MANQTLFAYFTILYIIFNMILAKGIWWLSGTGSSLKHTAKVRAEIGMSLSPLSLKLFPKLFGVL